MLIIALYRLLNRLIGEYTGRYDAEPVPADIALQSYQHLLAIVADTEVSMTAPASQQIQTPNELAAATLV
ncbi:MAG TPA: hypothetical protein VKR55_12040 [Bradyrhizobium sp.]|uniref:hypothetical protein n=1 Tax=Bradyrhizobium sp. TaxID=376 RepID=UPI002CBCF264|nr:hypothetical protein [Bradyrhizobium sp.]HLZ02869.1 hypothetical protein [Bradyrhizobium sp.]